jgi:ribosome-associated protein
LFKNTKDLTLFFARLLDEKKAKDTVILDINKISFVADYFIITTAQSPAHLKTLLKNILERSVDKGIKRNIRCEGNPQTGWVLIDCGDVVIHIFSENKRNYYNLEYIWQEAKKISL